MRRYLLTWCYILCAVLRGGLFGQAACTPADPPCTEAEALKQVYVVAQGERWRESTGWAPEDDMPMCQWYGIECDREGHVEEIFLLGNEMNGSLPDVFQNIPELRFVNVSLNYLRGELPSSLASLEKLRSFDVYWNELTVPLQLFSNLTSLTYLGLRKNKHIVGDLSELNGLRNLEVLDLRENAISGGRLDFLASMQSLEELRLDNCELSGELPDVFDGCPRLSVLSMANNRLEGTIPPSFSSLEALDYLDLASNGLRGPIRFLTSRALKTLKASYNYFSAVAALRWTDHPLLSDIHLSGNPVGPGEELLEMLRHLSQLRTFHCHSCGLRGRLLFPTNSTSGLVELVLDNNALHGELPEAFPGQLEVLGLSRNDFVGPVPLALRQLRRLRQGFLDSNMLTGDLPDILGEMAALEVFTLHDNELTTSTSSLRLPPGVQAWPLATNRTEEPTGIVVVSSDGSEGRKQREYRVCDSGNIIYAHKLESAGWTRTSTNFYHAARGFCHQSFLTGEMYHGWRVLSVQRTSRFPDDKELCDKGHLTQNVEPLRTSFPKEFAFYPESFVLPQQLEQWQQAYEASENKVWLLKPRWLCCGQGIQLVTGLDELLAAMNKLDAEWYIQRFVAPPALIFNPVRGGHYKFVFRLFALVTGFSPLRLFLDREGLLFYTNKAYSVDDHLDKRAYITDYVFTETQTEMYEFVSDYFEALRKDAKMRVSPEVIWQRITELVVRSILSTVSKMARMERIYELIPGSVHEVFGFDIVLDDNYMPYLCEVNQVPNMGVEVNRHPDRQGSGQHQQDLDRIFKTRLMRDFLKVADVEPRYTEAKRKQILQSVRAQVEDSLCGPGDATTAGCLSRAELQALARLEAELRSAEGLDMDVVFPCAGCEHYMPIVEAQRGLADESRINYLALWWTRVRRRGRNAAQSSATTPSQVVDLEETAEVCRKESGEALGRGGACSVPYARGGTDSDVGRLADYFKRWSPSMVRTWDYSLWLTPSGEALHRLQDVVKKFAAHYGTDAFIPHVTLFGGPFSVVNDEQMAEVLLKTRKVASNMKPFEITLRRVLSFNPWNQALILSADRHEELDAANMHAQRLHASGAAVTEPFFPPPARQPHVSILYKEFSSEAESKEAIRRLESEEPWLKDFSFNVSTVSLVYAGLAEGLQGIPNWRIIADFHFGQQ
eukprot:TRINITY_DN44030_c0_g1_i1.p1 TRINITY_DN44030_c0_g1~~TRINITY_DN44030_c0_g1_i1.p1  ORF type:complete len:1175 (-),score=218.51 TRINITY_DN44030_c0_g1_i1:195-3719(-)